MKTDLRFLLKEFHALPKTGQDSLLKDLYNFSNENKLMIANRLAGKADFGALVSKMENETVGKIYRMGQPGMIDGRKVNAIISSAKKARADVTIILELKKLAYRGFIEFMHEFGGGPDSYLDMAPRHLAEYLKLVKAHKTKEEATLIFEHVRHYLLKKDNMVTDYTDDVFEEITGLRVR